tara:strand:+ start:269 stop:1168 length:900 start_codon:yes stop_codon:yes gene_type:complete
MIKNKSKGRKSLLVLIALIIVGALAYLLDRTRVFNPSEGTTSGIKGVKKAKKDINKNEVVVELEGEEVQDVLNNPNFIKMVNSGDFQKMVKNEDSGKEFIKILDRVDISVLIELYNGIGQGLTTKDDANRRKDLVNAPKDEKERGRMGNITYSRDSYGSIIYVGSGRVVNGRLIEDNPDFTGTAVGFIGNPHTSDSGMGLDGGGVILVVAPNDVTGKIALFMKGSEFDKIELDINVSDFEKMIESPDFQKFSNNADFSTFMMRDDFRKFMKSSDYRKFADKGLTFEKLIKSRYLEKVIK